MLQTLYLALLYALLWSEMFFCCIIKFEKSAFRKLGVICDCFACRNDVAEMRLKLADAYLKLGEIGMETGISCCSWFTVDVWLSLCLVANWFLCSKLHILTFVVYICSYRCVAVYIPLLLFPVISSEQTKANILIVIVIVSIMWLGIANNITNSCLPTNVNVKEYTVHQKLFNCEQVFAV